MPNQAAIDEMNQRVQQCWSYTPTYPDHEIDSDVESASRRMHDLEKYLRELLLLVREWDKLDREVTAIVGPRK